MGMESYGATNVADVGGSTSQSALLWEWSHTERVKLLIESEDVAIRLAMGMESYANEKKRQD